MSIPGEQPPGGDMTAMIDQKEKRLKTIDFLFAGPLGCFVGLYIIHGEQVVAAFST